MRQDNNAIEWLRCQMAAASHGDSYGLAPLVSALALAGQVAVAREILARYFSNSGTRSKTIAQFRAQQLSLANNPKWLAYNERIFERFADSRYDGGMSLARLPVNFRYTPLDGVIGRHCDVDVAHGLALLFGHQGPCMGLFLSRSSAAQRMSSFVSFFVRSESPFLRPDPQQGQGRRAQGLSRLAGAPTFRYASLLRGHTLTASSTTARWGRSG
jgi:hypothetical protein